MAVRQPIITIKNWVKFCIKTAANDLTNLGSVMSVCIDMDAKLQLHSRMRLVVTVGCPRVPAEPREQ
eukprot:10864476-Prorocentrum_lima.AAC.1